MHAKIVNLTALLCCYSIVSCATCCGTLQRTVHLAKNVYELGISAIMRGVSLHAVLQTKDRGFQEPLAIYGNGVYGSCMCLAMLHGLTATVRM